MDGAVRSGPSSPPVRRVRVLARTLLVVGISGAVLAACDPDAGDDPSETSSVRTSGTTSTGTTAPGVTAPGTTAPGVTTPGVTAPTSGVVSSTGPSSTGATGHLTIVFTPAEGGCVADGIAGETFTLRAPAGTGIGGLGPVLESEVGEQRDEADPCAWDVRFSFRESDTTFVVADEANGTRWGPFSYGEMDAVQFTLPLTGEPRFNES